MDKKNHIISMVAVIIVVAGAAFYGGMLYGASKSTQASLQGAKGMAGGFGGGQRSGGAAGQGQGGPGGQRGGANGGAVGDFASGQITAKDDTSVTVKMRDGSSKIIFFSGSTGIDKSVSGTGSDLSVGQQVTVTGKSSPDGSLTAQTIQIRPAQPAGSAQ